MQILFSFLLRILQNWEKYSNFAGKIGGEKRVKKADFG